MPSGRIVCAQQTTVQNAYCIFNGQEGFIPFSYATSFVLQAWGCIRWLLRCYNDQGYQRTMQDASV